jgi:DNA-binding NarL/FixJ family response regulator
MRPISVILADDHTIVRKALKSLLKAETDIKIVGEAENGREAVHLCHALKPDVVVMDIAMPRLNGLEATRQIIRAELRTQVLILSSYDDFEHVQQSIEAGVTGYLIKQTRSEDLVVAIREVAKENAYFSPLVARHDQDALLQVKRLYTPKDRLTGRGREVLQLIAESLPTKLIALELNISVKAVEKHRRQIMNALDIHDIPGLTRYAVARGMIKVSRPLSAPPIPPPLEAVGLVEPSAPVLP